MSVITENPDGKAHNDAKPPKKPVSPAQLAANRANAQKSTGPKTAEGKAKTRFNSLKHGLTAMQICLPGESRAEYDKRRQEYIDIFKPANIVEWDILDDLVASRWRKQRGVKYERCILLDMFLRGRDRIAQDYKELSLDAEAALAFRELCLDPAVLKNLDRYETRLTRDILSNWRQLHEAIDNRPPASDGPAETSDPIPSDLRNEPISDPEPTEPEPSPDPEPVGNATQPGTIVRRLTTEPAPKTRVATNGWPSTYTVELATDLRPLTTDH